MIIDSLGGDEKEIPLVEDVDPPTWHPRFVIGLRRNEDNQTIFCGRIIRAVSIRHKDEKLFCLLICPEVFCRQRFGTLNQLTSPRSNDWRLAGLPERCGSRLLCNGGTGQDIVLILHI